MERNHTYTRRPDPTRWRRTLGWAGSGLFGVSALLFGARVATRLVAGVSTKARPPRQDAPALIVDATEYSFGRIPMGAVLDHRFHITNRGSHLVRIRHLSPCCGLTATIEGSPRLRPGETRLLRVRSGGRLTTGAEQRTIDVDTDDPAQPRFSVKVSWNIVSPFAVVPGNIEMGEVLKGKTAVRAVDLVNTPRGFRVLELWAEPAALTARVTSLPADAAYGRICVRLTPASLPAGEFRGQIRVRTTVDSWSWIAVPVRATVAEPIDIQPQKLFLGMIGTYVAPVLRATIVDRSHKPRKIRLVSRSTPHFQVVFRPESDGHSYEIAAMPKRRLPPGRVDEAVLLAAGDQRFRLAITGYVDPALD